MVVSQIFKTKSQEYPLRIALKYGHEVLTYLDLDYATDKLSFSLRKRGIKYGSVVGLQLIDPILNIKAIIALTKLGAIYVPIDSSQSKERIRDSCYVAKIDFLLSDESNLDLINLKIKKIVISKKILTLIESNTLDINPQISEESPLYIMFTSGTIGEPKGVIIPNCGVTRLVCNPNYIEISCNDVFLQLSSLTFDASTFEIWGALLNGATLVLIDKTFEISNISKILIEEKITILWLTSRLFDILVHQNISMFEGIKYLLFGGETCSFHYVKIAFDLLPNTILLNGYGPTENTTFTLVHKVTSQNIYNGIIPIGSPISETECYVLDDDLNILNENEPGILYVGGKGLALKYTDPDLTNERFIVHSTLNKRLYNTGDKVISRANSCYEYLGRIDRQIKIRGFRVELFSIESVIEKHPNIDKAIVAYNQVYKNNELAVFYTTIARITLEREVLVSFLEKKLPYYSIPSVFIQVAEFPLKSSGKVDLEKLIENNPSENEPIVNNVHNDKLKSLWSELLKIEVINDDTNFFNSGGDSLSSLKMIFEVERIMNIKLTTGYLKSNPTFKEFKENLFKESKQKFIQKLKDGKVNSPIYFIPWLFGDSSQYAHLAAKLETDQAAFSFRMVSICKTDVNANLIKNLAATYCKEIIKEHNPKTVTICGCSFGGIIAWELFSHLIMNNINVVGIHLFDSPESKFYSRITPLGLIEKIFPKLFDVKSLSKFIKPITIKSRKKKKENPNNQNVKYYRPTIYTYLRLLNNYKTQPINNVSVTLYRSKMSHLKVWKLDNNLGWYKYANKFDRTYVSGVHTSMLDPEYVSDLAKKLNDRIQHYG